MLSALGRFFFFCLFLCFLGFCVLILSCCCLFSIVPYIVVLLLVFDVVCLFGFGVRVIAFVVEVVVCFVVGCVIIVVIGLCLCLIDVGGLLLRFFCMSALGCPLIV